VLERPGGINRIPPQEPEPGPVGSLTPSRPAPLIADETQQGPAVSADAKPSAAAESQSPKPVEAQHEPVATVEAEPKADANPEPPKVEEAPIGAAPDLHTALPDLHETQTPGVHTEEQDGS
ncbi:MAG: hypothetical protein ABSE85_19685, partial [Candidatus Korobacteraceae bacterium]